MADLATTMRHVSGTADVADNVVLAHVLVRKRRERAERRERVAATIMGQGDTAG